MISRWQNTSPMSMPVTANPNSIRPNYERVPVFVQNTGTLPGQVPIVPPVVAPQPASNMKKLLNALPGIFSIKHG